MTWYKSIFIILSSFAIFVLIIINKDKITNKNITKLSKFSFGIYLIHVIFLIKIKDNFNIISFNPIICIPIFSAIIYSFSLISCYIIKKIPLINKII